MEGSHGDSMQGELPSWCLIDSDPDVFGELVANIGVRGIQFEHIYSLDEEAFAQLLDDFQSVYGIIFLFKWGQSDVETFIPRDSTDSIPPDLYFAQQVIPNACATQAIVSVLLNMNWVHADIDIGPHLRDLKQFSQEFSPYNKGLVLSNSETLREAHNAFDAHHAFEYAKSAENDADKDAFHFVAYIPFNDHVYELDGLQERPRLVGKINVTDPGRQRDEAWLDIVRRDIKRRVDQQSGPLASEIRFNAMAVVNDRLVYYEKELRNFRRERFGMTVFALSYDVEGVELHASDTDDADDTESCSRLISENDGRNVEEVVKEIATYTRKINTIKHLIQTERAKRMTIRKENVRRKHDYVPLVLCVLKHLARNGTLKKKYDLEVQAAALSAPSLSQLDSKPK